MDVPSFDNSAMDGYAVRCADFAGQGPWRLPLAGESRAGTVPERLAVGSTCSTRACATGAAVSRFS